VLINSEVASSLQEKLKSDMKKASNNPSVLIHSDVATSLQGKMKSDMKKASNSTHR
jgi:hypothetical protein